MREKEKVPWRFCHLRLELAHRLCSRTSQINVTCFLAEPRPCLTTQHCSPARRQRGPAFLYLSRSLSPKPPQGHLLLSCLHFRSWDTHTFLPARRPRPATPGDPMSLLRYYTQWSPQGRCPGTSERGAPDSAATTQATKSLAHADRSLQRSVMGGGW